eukprot:GHVO01014975.1.p2 GENE.GHVO01014975.1~~GHVO01014975.1.p2  ORF type:complete len:104 (+),score=4.74 GHVO01014975.1:324-635(+)
MRTEIIDGAVCDLWFAKDQMKQNDGDWRETIDSPRSTSVMTERANNDVAVNDHWSHSDMFQFHFSPKPGVHMFVKPDRTCMRILHADVKMYGSQEQFIFLAFI